MTRLRAGLNQPMVNIIQPQGQQTVVTIQGLALDKELTVFLVFARRKHIRPGRESVKGSSGFRRLQLRIFRSLFGK